MQKKIQQDSFSASFNSGPANTCRMMTLRCPWNGKIVVLKTMMRLGVSDKIVDNMMQGGLCVNIDAQGKFSRFGYDYDGQRFERHPISNALFDGLSHPHYRNMTETAKQIAAKIPYYNLLSFDLLPDKDGNIKCVEINATSQGITQLQYDHGGLFGDLSEKVVDWCAQHRELTFFEHFRTFY